jgi:hypothetical protein
MLISVSYSFAQSVTLSNTSYNGTGYCSATNANKSYGLMNTTYNGKNQYEYSFTGTFGIGCSFIIRWEAGNWELVSKEQTDQTVFKFTTLSTVAGNTDTPPCGLAFGGIITGDCSQNCTASMSVSGSGTICFGASANLTATGCTGTVSWDNGGGTGTSITVSPESSTTYTATCSDSEVCPASALVEVNKPTAPQIMIVGMSVVDNGNNNFTSCSGAYVQLLCTNCDAPEKTINWSNGMTSTNGPISAAFIPASSGSYSATQTISGCTGPVGNTVALTLKNSVIIQPGSITISGNTITICKGSSITLTASGCPGVITWNNDAGTGTSITLTPNFNTNYTATCSDNEVCSANTQINVVAPGSAPHISGTTTVICPGRQIGLYSSGCGSGKFLWSTGATTNSIGVTTPGTYSMICTTSLPGCNSPQSNIVTVTTAISDMTLTGTASNGDIQVVQTITSTQTISNNLNSGYYAGKSITLSPSFTAQSGAVFNAEIRESCN